MSVSVAPSGDGGGAVGSRGPEPATVDIARRQLGEQETLAELAQARNELLEDLRGQGGGGAGAGSTLLQVQGARSILGGVAGGLTAGGLAGRLGGGASGLLGLLTGGGAAARLGGGAFSPGIFGQGSAITPGEDILAGGPIFEGLNQAVTDLEGLSQEDFFDIPEGIGIETPAEWPPELNVPQIPSSIGVDVPPELASALGIDVNVDIGGEVQFSGLTEEFIEQPGRGPRFEQEAAEERRRIENKVRTQLDQFEQRLLREIGGDTSSSRVAGPTTSTGL